MTPFTGRAIGLTFALLWWMLGAAALPLPWRFIVGAMGLATIVSLFIRVRQIRDERTGLFRRRRYWIAVGLELAALAGTNALLHRYRLDGYLLPSVAIIVGLHFYGLWWAGGGFQYTWLATALTSVGMIALLLPTGQIMQAFTGFASAVCLSLAASTGARR